MISIPETWPNSPALNFSELSSTYKPEIVLFPPSKYPVKEWKELIEVPEPIGIQRCADKSISLPNKKYSWLWVYSWSAIPELISFANLASCSGKLII